MRGQHVAGSDSGGFAAEGEADGKKAGTDHYQREKQSQHPAGAEGDFGVLWHIRHTELALPLTPRLYSCRWRRVPEHFVEAGHEIHRHGENDCCVFLNANFRQGL